MRDNEGARSHRSREDRSGTVDIFNHSTRSVHSTVNFFVNNAKHGNIERSNSLQMQTKSTSMVYINIERERTVFKCP